MMDGLAAEAAVPKTVMIDSIYLKAHRTATGGAVCPHPHQPARGLQRELGDRLIQRQNACVQKNGRDADRVGSGHWRHVLRLHDDEGRIGFGAVGQNQEVDMAEHPAARFVQHEVTQGLVLRNSATLFPDCVTGRRHHPADDHVTDLALGMYGNYVDGLAVAQLSSLSVQPAR